MGPWAPSLHLMEAQHRNQQSLPVPTSHSRPPTNRSNQVNNILLFIIIHITQGRHGLSLNLDHINIPTQNTNWSTRSLGKKKKKKKNPPKPPKKKKKKKKKK